MRAIHVSPDFVPHEEWDRYAWLVPHDVGAEPWYYAARKGDKPTERGLPSNPGFIRTVDPDIRPLVSWLHSRGIPTGPSCSGHDITKRGFEDIYAGLERDGEEIRTIGIALRDPEDGRDYMALDENYELPWSSFEEFHKKAQQHQPIGWLPFYTTDPRVELALGAGPGFEIKQTGENSYGIRTDGMTSGAWRKAAAALAKAVG